VIKFHRILLYFWSNKRSLGETSF